MTFGRNRAVTDLTLGDFGELRARLAKTMAAVTLRNEMQRARSVFKFGFDEGLLSTPLRFGQSFGRPRLDVVRKAREAHRAAHGDRMFEAHEIRAILAEAEQPLRAIVLLGANGAFGQSDLSALPVRAVDVKAGWVDFARVKTAVPRRVPLWPETVEALRRVMSNRPGPSDAGSNQLVFLTSFGRPWVRDRIHTAPDTGIRKIVPVDAIGHLANTVEVPHGGQSAEQKPNGE